MLRIFFYKTDYCAPPPGFELGLPDLEPDDHPDYGSLVLNILCSDSTRFRTIISLRWFLFRFLPCFNFQGAHLYSAAPRLVTFLIFGFLSIVAGFLTLLLPETLNRDLPDTVRQAEHLGHQVQWRLLFGDFLGLNFLNEFLKKVLNLLLGF